MNDWLRFVIAFVVGCHASIYIPLGVVLPKHKEWHASSSLLGGAITGDRLSALVLVLHATAGVVLLGCAVAIAFAPWVPRWWRPLAIVGAGLGLAAFAWGTESSPQVGTAPPTAPRAPGYH